MDGLNLPETMLHCIVCIAPGKTDCPFRAIRPANLGDNAMGFPNLAWCSKWRMNRARDKAYCQCQPEYLTEV